VIAHSCAVSIRNAMREVCEKQNFRITYR
jgi:hypothetical protein